MENKKKMWHIITLIALTITLIVTYKIYKVFSELDEAMQPTTTSTPLHFEDLKKTIYIKTKVWGLLGGHSRIFISEKEDDYSMKNDSIIFERATLYYKIQSPDSLLIFLPSMSYSEERNISKVLNGIKIEITEFKASKNKEYKEKYKEMGLKKIKSD